MPLMPSIPGRPMSDSQREAFDTSCLRVETIDTDICADIDSSPLIFGDTRDLIARESFLHGVTHKAWTILSWIIDATQTAFRTCNPKTSQVIHVQRAYQSRRHAVWFSERLEFAVAITRQTAPVESDPKVPFAIFLKCSRRTVGALRDVLSVRVNLARCRLKPCNFEQEIVRRGYARRK